MTVNNYVVILFIGTAGRNGDDMGSDEQQIVIFAYCLYDLVNAKAVCVQHHYVRPIRAGDEAASDVILTEECRVQCGITDDVIKNAGTLEHVLDEFDRFLSAKEIHPDHGGRPFCLVTDGQLPLRMVIQPESCTKNINLPKYFYKFYDIRKEFRKFYKTDGIHSVKDMLDYVALEEHSGVEYGVRQCQEMAQIITRLLTDGHVFSEPETIKDKLEPGICTSTEYVDDETVVRARGLPWQSSDQDIALFFRGLNVAKGGVALCLSQHGRRNGEALIRFDCKEHRDLALRKHKHHLGQRYIEVYKASGKDFVSVAGGSNSEAQAFLSRHSDAGTQVIVRMRGLPYSCTSEQVLEFFRNADSPCEVLDGEEGILFVHQADGRATGDAFVLFGSEDDAQRALSRHRDCIGTRYIELFKSTTAEVQQVLNRSMDPRTPKPDELAQPPLIPQLPGQIPGALPGQLPGLLPGAGAGQLPQAPIIIPQQLITSGQQKDCIRMRGLPFECSVTDILSFLGDSSRCIVFQGVHMVYNAQGTPSGEAFIQMDTEASAENAALTKHKKFMIMGNKRRYIEVIQCSGEDMNLVLTNGVNLPSAAGTAMIPTTPMLSIQRPSVLPPGSSIISPGNAGGLPTPGVPAGTFPGMLPPSAFASAATTSTSAQLPVTSQGMNNAVLLPGMQMSGMLPAGGAQAQLGALNPRPGLPYQPMMYWYPSPPVSPQSAYYMQGQVQVGGQQIKFPGQELAPTLQYYTDGTTAHASAEGL